MKLINRLGFLLAATVFGLQAQTNTPVEVKFSAREYVVSATATTASVTVFTPTTFTGSLAVLISTSDGTAVAGVDYTAFTVQNNVTTNSKQITIQIGLIPNAANNGKFFFVRIVDAFVESGNITGAPVDPVQARVSIGTSTAEPKKLLNLSTRLKVGSGDAVAIGGFIISGSANKTVVLRALTSTLTNFSFSNSQLATTPRVRVVKQNGSAVGSSETSYSGNPNQLTNTSGSAVYLPNYGSLDATQQNQIKNVSGSSYATNDDEIVSIVTLAPGAYTAIVDDASGKGGIVLFELYDVDPNSSSELSNLSTRGLTDTGDDGLILGFILGGAESDETQNVVVRGLGLSLRSYGVNGSIVDAQMTIFNGQGTVVATNQDWGTADTGVVSVKPYAGISTPSEMNTAGYGPRSSSDSGMLIKGLHPGRYTILIRGVKRNGAGTVVAYDRGITLAEVYRLPSNGLYFSGN